MTLIKDDPRYFITTKGLVYNIRTRKFHTNTKHSQGYLSVSVGGRKRLVHRLVAENFIPNPNDKPCVNHIDGDKTNNHVSNLEWVTHKENSHHAWKIGINEILRENNSKIVLDTSTGVYYNSAREACVFYNIKESTLVAQLNGRNRNKTKLIYV